MSSFGRRATFETNCKSIRHDQCTDESIELVYGPSESGAAQRVAARDEERRVQRRVRVVKQFTLVGSARTSRLSWCMSRPRVVQPNELQHATRRGEFKVRRVASGSAELRAAVACFIRPSVGVRDC
jgi:hypothetical protein